jgi:hypothetical protein
MERSDALNCLLMILGDLHQELLVPAQTDFLILRKSRTKDLCEGRGFNRDLIGFEVNTVLACTQFGLLAVMTHGFSQLNLCYLISVLVMQKEHFQDS